MLAICPDHQAAIRARLGLELEPPLSPPELLGRLAAAPAAAAIEDPDLAAFALILHRTLRERGLGALLEERCAICAAGAGGELELLAFGLTAARELAGVA